MSWTRWILGLIVIAATFVPPMAGAVVLRRRALPMWSGFPALVADAVIGITTVVLLAEALGTVGLLAEVPLLVGGPLAGAALVAASRAVRIKGPALAPEAGGWGLGGRAETALAAIASAGVLAQAAGSVAVRATHGIADPDSLHYHLTFAAEFAKRGSTASLVLVSPGDGAPYHPATSELLHALGLVAFRVEVLSLVLNLGAIALALAAAGAIGARVGRGGLAITSIAAVLTLPMLGRGQAGSPANDVVAIAFLLAGVGALLWSADAAGADRRAGLVVAGLAMGLGVGTKLTVAVPIGVLAIVTASAAPSIGIACRRLVSLGVPAVVAGGYWPLRNLIHVGSPYPAMRIPGLPQPPMPLLDEVDQSVLHYAFDRSIVRTVFMPGVEHAMGPARYPLLAFVALAGLALLVRADDRFQRLLVVVGGVAAVSYLIMPTTAGGPEGAPSLFRFNVRYVGPALCILAVASALTPLAARRARLWAGAWLAIEVVTLSSADGWADPGWRLPIVGAAALIAVTAALVATLQPWAWPRAAWAAVAVPVVLVVLGGGGVAARAYVEEYRYARPQRDRDLLIALSRSVEGGRIGVTGFPLTYPFFGPGLEGDASYISDVAAGNEVRDPDTCLAWRAALRQGRYDRVVVIPFVGRPDPITFEWTSSIPGVQLSFRNGAGSDFHLPPLVTDEGC